ncbi:reverse transcriptase family protein [Pelomonas sp. Root1237]|uniref:reverse transcriptase family protein n=1 Tax=Pelomonas sp. Root1237 TaxID=1736434 RepID=UPI0012FAA50E|nr:reverse transcriptase family protein [Pelomonas sp. Root1237]
MKRPYLSNQSPLYCLESRKRLAGEILGLSLPKLEGLAARANNYRECTRVTGGKQRTVHVPMPLLLAVHRRLAVLLNRIAVPHYLQSGQTHRSHLTNARAHETARNIAKLDIRHFYPSITKDRVWHLFVDGMLCSRDVASLLARLFTHQGSAPIGSPVSQVLAFHVVRPMLDELQELASRHRLRFTCYVDDLTFSGDGADHGFLALAGDVARRHGFLPHAEACYGPGEDKLVTGVMLTRDGLRVPAPQLRRIDAARQELLLAEGNESRRVLLSRLIGHLAAAASVDDSFRPELSSRCFAARKLAAALPARPSPSDSKVASVVPRLRPMRLSYGVGT